MADSYQIQDIKNPWVDPEGNVLGLWGAVGLIDELGVRNTAIGTGTDVLLDGFRVKIGIYDSEFNVNHVQLAQRDLYGAGGSLARTTLHDIDPNYTFGAVSHGTHVASIAAGRYGVAPGADLHLYAGTSDGKGRVTAVTNNNVFNRMAADGVDVANFSLSAVDTLAHDVRAIHDHGLIVVMAAGNARKANANPYTIKTAFDLSTNWNRPGGLGIIVGALNFRGDDLAGMSNAAGSVSAKLAWGDAYEERQQSHQYFITAPGSSVNAAWPGDGSEASPYGDNEAVGVQSGTSMATPFVTGAAALVLEKWPHLRQTPEMVAAVLFITADRDFDAYRASLADNEGGVGGVGITEAYYHFLENEVDGIDGYELSEVFGHGRLDIQAALTENIGTLMVALGETLSADAAAVTTTSLSLGAPFGDAMSNVAALDGLMVTDYFGRDFKVDLSGAVRHEQAWFGGHDYGAALAGLATQSERTQYESLIGDTLTLTTRSSGSMAGLSARGRAQVEDFSVELDFAGGRRLGLHQGASDRELPWLKRGLSDQGLLFGLGDGYLSDWDRQSAVRFDQPLHGDNYSIGFTMSRADDALRLEGGEVTPGTANRYQMNIQGDVLPGTSVLLDAGVINQDQRLFNTRSTGALSFGERAKTLTASLALRHARQASFGELAFFGWHQQGSTDVHGNRGLLRDFGAVRTAQTAIGADARWNTGLRFGAVYSQPLRVLDARATLDVPVSREIDGTVNRASHSVNMAPEGREQRLEIYMERPFAPTFLVDGTLRINAAARHEPGNIAGAKDEGFVGLVYQGRL